MTAAFLALGDSYTIGEGVPAGGTWPAQLAAMLRAEGHDLGTPEIIATTGWTTDELDAAIDARDPTAGRALVSLLIGVNNQYRGRDVDAYRVEFAALLARAIGFADGHAERVVVVSIPDWGVTPFAQDGQRDVAVIAAAIDAFNAAAREETARRGARWVDVTAISRGPARDLLAEDGLHPSAAQYIQWARAVLAQARDVLDGMRRRES